METLFMEVDINTLAIQNPWWWGESLEYDPVLEEYDRSELPFRWNVFQEKEFFRDSIYLVQGSRGIGKTTLLKTWIRYLLDRYTPPSSVFYCACYGLTDPEELNEVIRTFLDKKGREKEGRCYIFLDEVVLVQGWQYGLEQLKREGWLKNVTVVATGSTAEEVIYSFIDLRYLYPLSFPQFVSLYRPDLDITKKEDHKYLDYYLDAYFLTGGFPSAINDFYTGHTVRQRVYNDLLYWLIADIAFIGRDMLLAEQILDNIISTAGRPVGYKTLARGTKAESHLTVKDYLKVLEKMFGIRLLYQADSKGRKDSAKNKKIYFEDPFLFWLFYCYTHHSLHYWRFARQSLHRRDVFNFLTEQVIFNHLTKIKNARISYRRDTAQKEEIDLLVSPPQNKTLPVMLAREDKGTSRCRQILEKEGFRRGIIITEEEGSFASKKFVQISLLEFLLHFEEYVKS